MEEKKKRNFVDNELRKHRISMAQRRKFANLRKEKINEEVNGEAYANSDSIEFIEQEYIKLSNNIANQFLNICDKMIVRNMLGDKVRHFHQKQMKGDKEGVDIDNQNKKNNGKRLIITPEQRDRIFSIEGGDNDEENR